MIPYNDLEFFERVGHGGFGTVYRGRWKPMNRVVAIKEKDLQEETEVCQLISLRLQCQIHSKYCVMIIKL